MSLSCPSGLLDWSGYAAGLAGIIGSLLLVRPLFLLLRSREAMESISYGLDVELLPADLRGQAVEARKQLSMKLFKHRRRWKPWTFGGVAFLLLALLAVLVQGVCLGSSHSAAGPAAATEFGKL